MILTTQNRTQKTKNMSHSVASVLEEFVGGDGIRTYESGLNRTVCDRCLTCCQTEAGPLLRPGLEDRAVALRLGVAGHELRQRVDGVLAFEQNGMNGRGDRHFDLMTTRKLHHRSRRRDAFGHA